MKVDIVLINGADVIEHEDVQSAYVADGMYVVASTRDGKNVYTRYPLTALIGVEETVDPLNLNI